MNRTKQRTTDKWLTLTSIVMGGLVVLSVLACGGGSVDDDPAPPSSSFDDCGGIAGLTCQNPDEVCITEQAQNCGYADQTGTCQLPPDTCTEQYAPVCGCDGHTYSNECQAHAVGISVSSQGECPTSSDTCGGLAGFTCARDEVCVYEPAANCGRADATGACQTQPTFCTEQYAPVCGCDGQTYSNGCKARAAGVSVDHMGRCASTNGCTTNAECHSDDYCSMASADQCGAQGTGTCTAKPDLCTQLYDPVCGCDGRDYSNACMAAAHGISVAHQGPCSNVQ